MGFWTIVFGTVGGGGGVPSPGAIDAVWFGIVGLNWPPVTGPGVAVADPGYFTLNALAMPWAGMGVTDTTVTPTRTGDLEWDADDVSGGLDWDPDDVTGALQWDEGPVAVLTWE
jgi:hypothetical protein